MVTYLVWYLERREWRMRDIGDVASEEDPEKREEGFEKTRNEKRESKVADIS